jgi:hypothetical protein
VRTPLLFSPEKVRETLERLLSLAVLLPDPGEEGVESEAWPGVLRKTDRELYRWLANTDHYDHLAEVVGQLERVNAAGCSIDGLLKTRSREQFVGHTSELLVADDLLDRGYEVRTVERSGETSPDLLVSGDGIEVAVEVYSPRELRAVDAFVNDVVDLLNNADVAADYTSSAETKIERALPPPPEQFDPWGPDKHLEQTADQVFAEISEDVQNALSELRPLSKVYGHGDTPLLTTVEIENVERSSEQGPARRGSFSYPGFSGYSPAGVFRTVVGRALKKAKKRQASGVDASARALVVNLMGTKIAEDLVRSEVHLNQAAEAANGIDPHEYELDVIAFVVRVFPRGLASIVTIAEDTSLPIAEVNAMFGATTEATEARREADTRREGEGRDPGGHARTRPT